MCIRDRRGSETLCIINYGLLNLFGECDRGIDGNRVACPGFGLEQFAGLNRLLHQLGALGIDLTAAQGIVTYLRVTHVIVCG